VSLSVSACPWCDERARLKLLMLTNAEDVCVELTHHSLLHTDRVFYYNNSRGLSLFRAGKNPVNQHLFEPGEVSGSISWCSAISNRNCDWFSRNLTLMLNRFVLMTIR